MNKNHCLRHVEPVETSSSISKDPSTGLLG